MINKPGYGKAKGFPSQYASDIEKESVEYGLQVGLAIESEWFSRDYGSSLYGEIRSEFIMRRLYARGEQPVTLKGLSFILRVISKFSVLFLFEKKYSISSFSF